MFHPSHSSGEAIRPIIIITLKSKVPQTRYHTKTKKKFFVFAFLAIIFGRHGSYQFLRAAGAPVRRRRGAGAPAARKNWLFFGFSARLNLSRKYFGSENLAKTLRKPCENLPKTSRKPPGNLAKTSRTPWESCGTNAPTVPYFSTWVLFKVILPEKTKVPRAECRFFEIQT